MAQRERAAYREAADHYVSVVEKVQPEQWEAPGLGEWNVRELVAHTARAMLTVEQYAASPASAVEVRSSVEYYKRAMATADINRVVADRGRRTASELGPDLLAAVTTIRDRVLALLDTLPDDFVFGTGVGGIRLGDYLPTRTVELVVHTLDLQAATQIEGEPPKEATRMTLHVLADLAVESPHAGRLALLATGRDVWQGPFTVLG